MEQLLLRGGVAVTDEDEVVATARRAGLLNRHHLGRDVDGLVGPREIGHPDVLLPDRAVQREHLPHFRPGVRGRRQLHQPVDHRGHRDGRRYQSRPPASHSYHGRLLDLGNGGTRLHLPLSMLWVGPDHSRRRALPPVRGPAARAFRESGRHVFSRWSRRHATAQRYRRSTGPERPAETPRVHGR